MERPEDGWHKVSDLAIDAGTLYVGDPCYFWPKDGMSTEARTPSLFQGSIPDEWQAFCQYLDDRGAINGCLDLDHGSGAIISGFGGDVPCEVWVLYKYGQVSKVELRFDPEEEDEDENEWDDVLEDYGDDEEEE